MTQWKAQWCVPLSGVPFMRAEFRQPMAVAVIGGLITSTLLSLVLVPVVYEFVDDFENWLKPKLARLVTPREPPRQMAPEDRL